MRRSAIRRLEGGAGITAQTVIYVFTLFIAFALVYDLGNVALVSQIANTAARTAALDAAKELARDSFEGTQHVKLDEDAAGRAADTVAGLVPAPVQDLSISVNGGGRDALIQVSFRVRAATPILRATFGLQGIEVPAHAAATLAAGSEGLYR